MIDAKMSFMAQMRKALADTLTVEQMEKMVSAGMGVLDRFVMHEIATGEDGPDDLLESYVAAMQVEGRSQKTIDRYVYMIGKLMAFAKVPTRRISVYHIRSFISEEKERGIQDSTLEGHREIFTAYFNWLQRESLIEKNPTVNLGVIKVAKKEKKTYTERELERLLADYLAERKDENPALFVSRLGKRMQPGGVREMLNVLAEKAGVEHVHPHKFRRTLATGLTRHGMPIQEVARILGHEKLDTTMKYVMLNNDDVKASYRRFA